MFKYSVILIIICFSVHTKAQERSKDTIDTDVVNVIKPYSPTISDAFKIKGTPTINDSTTGQKRPVKYNIFSIPVASTFTPAKGKAATVDKAKPVKLYDNYASLGVGTYTTILGEIYLNHELSNNERVGGYFSHHSSAGDIPDINFDNNFSETELSAHYSQKLSDFSWKVDGGFQLQTFNWYGLPDQTVPTFDVDHSFYSANVGGHIKFEDAVINNGSVRYRRFGDDQDSGENRFILTSEFDIPISNELVNTEFKLDYIGGSFDRNYLVDEELNYGNINLGVAPSYEMKQDDLSISLGVNMVYLNDTEASENKFFIYPNMSASYRVVNDIMIAFASIKGDLNQNSYFDFAQENPFVSPTLFIAPTDQRYNTSLGLKGKLSNNLSYNISGHYIAEKGKALFRTNPVIGTATENYQFGNSTGVVYDDVDTFSIAGELNLDINRNFKLILNAEYFGYDTDDQAEVWNLPDIKASLFLDYQIDEHWFAGANLFYVGERKDQFSIEQSFLPTGPPQTITLDSFFDINAHLGYKINSQWAAFIKANNIADQDYQQWQNFPVQRIQFLAGATYQFDF
ncbi:MAG: TonB-dependent receptor [Psychroserpens sp.]|nr:TonB-dependent receptor [Psychroserpens sp.]